MWCEQAEAAASRAQDACAFALDPMELVLEGIAVLCRPEMGTERPQVSSLDRGAQEVSAGHMEGLDLASEPWDTQE